MDTVNETTPDVSSDATSDAPPAKDWQPVSRLAIIYLTLLILVNAIALAIAIRDRFVLAFFIAILIGPIINGHFALIGSIYCYLGNPRSARALTSNQQLVTHAAPVAFIVLDIVTIFTVGFIRM